MQWRGAGWSEKLVIQHLHLASPRYQTCKLASQKCQSGKIEIFMQREIRKFPRKSFQNILILERSAKLRLENSICWHQQGPGEKSRRNSILSFIWYSTRHLAQNLAKYLSFNLESKFKQRRKLTTRNMSIVDWAPLSSPLCLSVCLCPQTVSSHQYYHHHHHGTHIGW